MVEESVQVLLLTPVDERVAIEVTQWKPHQNRDPTLNWMPIY